MLLSSLFGCLPCLGADKEGPEGSKKKGKKRGCTRCYDSFVRQEFVGWSPIITGSSVLLYFGLVFCLCIALGVPILTASLNVVEYSSRYDNTGPMAGLDKGAQQAALFGAGGEGVATSVSIPVTRTMRQPVYLYYELHSYFQNHKRYVRSHSSKQTAGYTSSADGVCSPEQYVGGGPNAALPNGGQINPCGLIAYSFFNDTFTVSVGGQPVAVDEDNIAWPYDREHLYGSYTPVNFNTDPATRGGGNATGPLNQDSHLIVWLRPAAKPSFRKLWGIIRQDIPAGSVVQVNVLNRYNTYDFQGAKNVVLSTNSWMGGKNLFLGIVYLVLAGLAGLTWLFFCFTYTLGCFGALRKRKFGDPAELSWNKKEGSR